MSTHPEDAQQAPAPTPDDWLYGLEDTSPRSPVGAAPVRGHGGLRETRAKDRPPVSNWFGDPTPGGGEDGRPVPCTVCGAGLSQPRIDHGLTTCSRCRPVGPAPDASCAARS